MANLAQFLMVGALFAFQFTLGVYLQFVLGFGPAAAGIAFLPITIVIGLFSLVLTPRLVLRRGGKPVLITGLAVIAVELAAIAVGGRARSAAVGRAAPDRRTAGNRGHGRGRRTHPAVVLTALVIVAIALS